MKKLNQERINEILDHYEREGYQATYDKYTLKECCAFSLKYQLSKVKYFPIELFKRRLEIFDTKHKNVIIRLKDWSDVYNEENLNIVKAIFTLEEMFRLYFQRLTVDFNEEHIEQFKTEQWTQTQEVWAQIDGGEKVLLLFINDENGNRIKPSGQDIKDACELEYNKQRKEFKELATYFLGQEFLERYKLGKMMKVVEIENHLIDYHMENKEMMF